MSSTSANAIVALSYRDLLKFLRDPIRMVSTLVFPLIFIAILGGSFQASLGDEIGYNYLIFTFTGVLAQTMFQSSAMGLVSLIEDRENDYSQEIFVSPISRYAIIFGKIFGESLVAMAQGIAIIVFAMILTIPMSLQQFLLLGPTALIVSVYGGAFGVLIMANLNSQRAANQVFPFIMLPQFFLAGVFTPINNSPWYLNILSILSPMRYPVDLVRGVYYMGTPQYSKVVLLPPSVNLMIIIITFGIFIFFGTFVFVRKEKNK